MRKKLEAPVANVINEKSAMTDAIQAIHAASGVTARINTCDTHGMIGEISAATKPTIVIGATAGAARTFATMLSTESCPEIATMTGAQNKVAASGVAITVATAFGIFAENFSTRGGARIKRPAVAKTDKAKPGSRTCHGSATTTAAIAKPSAGRESRPRCVPCAINKTDAIAAARSTEGDGRTRAIKAMRNMAVAPRRKGILRKINCIM